MYGYIYKTTNLFNGKIYVGQHRAPEFDYNYYGSGVIICNLINKYGKASFTVECIEECDSEDELNQKEIYWIAKLDATNEDVGYNLMSGGYMCPCVKHSQRTKDKISKKKRGCKPNRIYHTDDATKLKISNTLKEYYRTHESPKRGRPISQEQRIQISNTLKGRPCPEVTRNKLRGRTPWNKGVPMSEDAKQNLRNKLKGKPLSEETKQKLKGRTPWNKGVKMSDETRQKLSDAMKGKPHPYYRPGYVHSEETRKKISEGNKGKHSSAELSEKMRKIMKGKNAGCIWICNGNISKRIMPEELDNYIAQGYHRGRK